MDTDSESAKMKLLVIGLLVFLVTGCISYSELAYLLGGHKATARVSRVREVEEVRRIGTRTMHAVEYEFTDSRGNHRRGSDRVDVDWPVTEGAMTDVQYRSGTDGDSRLAGHVNWVGSSVFFAAAIYLTIAGYRFWREVSEGAAEIRKSRRR